MKILILGVNGFIGNALTDTILNTTDWEVYGLDMGCDKIAHLLDHPRFNFLEGDITINKEWIEYHVKKADVVLPLVAIATPMSYVKEPLKVFELDFEANLAIVRQCVKYGKRVVFPSTSEVYGMCSDAEFDEEKSNFTYGPINKQRWIYSCSKQLMDRVIHAYGMSHGLDYTLFRPFNWIGPKLDSISTPKEGSSRVLTQFIGNIFRRVPIKLVDGGHQRRCFTDLEDGIDALMRIIRNQDNVATRRIFNIGNPANDISIRDLAHQLAAIAGTYPSLRDVKIEIIEVASGEYYGDGYQDIISRVPNIENARRRLGWTPRFLLDDTLKKTLDYYVTYASDCILE